MTIAVDLDNTLAARLSDSAFGNRYTAAQGGRLRHGSVWGIKGE